MASVLWDLALKAALKSRTNTAMALYKGLRNPVIKELRTAKSTHYIAIITEAKGNNSLIWKQINSLIKPQANIKKSQKRIYLRLWTTCTHI